MTKKYLGLFRQIHNPLSCSPACRCSSTLQTSLRFFLFGQTKFKHNAAAQPVPGGSSTPKCTARQKKATLSQFNFFLSISLLLQFQSLSLSLHVSSLLLRHCLLLRLSFNAKFLFLLAFLSLLFSLCLLSVTSAGIPSEKKDSMVILLLWGPKNPT